MLTRGAVGSSPRMNAERVVGGFEQLVAGAGQRAPLGIRAVTADAFDLADLDDCLDLCSGLPAASEHCDLARVLAREITSGKPGRGGNAKALDHAIGKDRERLSGRR